MDATPELDPAGDGLASSSSGLSCLAILVMTSFGLGVSLAFFLESLSDICRLRARALAEFLWIRFSTDLAAAAVREDNKKRAHQR
jgi:hypothetical protein